MMMMMMMMIMMMMMMMIRLLKSGKFVETSAKKLKLGSCDAAAYSEHDSATVVAKPEIFVE